MIHARSFACSVSNGSELYEEVMNPRGTGLARGPSYRAK